MRQLELIIPSKNKEVSLSRQVPEKWDELSRKQLLRCIRLLFGYQPGHMQRRLLLKELLQLPSAAFESIEPELMVELLSLVDFLQHTNSLTKQLLPVLRLPLRNGWRRVYGPQELFLNLTFAEFVEAEKYFFRFSNSKEPEHLNQLIATLYRPKRWLHSIRKRLGNYHGDIRSDFNEHLVPEQAKAVAGLSDEVKIAVLTWYRGCREFIEELYGDVFYAENEERKVHPADTGWEPVMRGMSGGKFGDFTKTKVISMHTMLREMDQHIRQMREQEAKNKSNH